MADFGYVLLVLTFVASVYAACVSIVGHARGSSRMAASAEYAVYAVFGLLTTASMVLVHGFVIGDYSLKYVAEYSDRSMPLFYKVTAMWGGQDGSLLFWVLVMSILAASR